MLDRTYLDIFSLAPALIGANGKQEGKARSKASTPHNSIDAAGKDHREVLSPERSRRSASLESRRTL